MIRALDAPGWDGAASTQEKGRLAIEPALKP
jgi:hypothetical protein